MEKDLKLKKAGEKHYSLDIRGNVCPYPQILTLRALSQLDSGDTLEVTLDNPPSVRDIPPVLENTGFIVSDISSTGNGVWRIVIRL